MVRQSEYGAFAEKLVYSHLKKRNKNVFKKKSKGYHFRFGDVQVGKNKETCKIIEVKGQGEDWGPDKGWDFVRSNIRISTAEYKFLKKYPTRFFIYVVYRLKYNKNPKWNVPKIAICEGNDLAKLEPKITQIGLTTPKEFWKKSIQIFPNRKLPAPK